MRSGQTLVINCEKTVPNFTADYNTPTDLRTWPTKVIFNQNVWAQKDNYMKIVRSDENFMLGGLNPGAYSMQSGFNIIILSSGDDNVMNKLADTIPHFDRFKKIKIRNEIDTN